MFGSTAVTIVDGADEAGDVVDVAVGVVAGDSAPQPDHLLDAEIVVECLLELLAANAGIALLHFAEQAFFGRQQDALAVGIDGAAFEDEPALLTGKCRWLAAIGAVRAIPRRDPGIWSSRCQSGYLAQALKRQLVMATWPCAIADEDRAGIAGPDAVGGPLVEADVVEIGVSAIEDTGWRGACSFSFCTRRWTCSRIGEQPDDFGVEPRDGLEFSGPVFGIVRPCQPGCLVRLPFGGHAVAKLVWRFVHFFR